MVLLILTIVLISKNKTKLSLISFSLAILCHNSVLIFLPLFIFNIFNGYKTRFLLILFAFLSYLYISFIIPYQPSVDNDNRIIYAIFSIFCLLTFFINKKNYSGIDLLLITSIILTLPFFNLESYYDRLGLYSAFFGSILVSKKIINTRPTTIGLIIAIMAMFFSFFVVSTVTYPPLIA